MKALAINHCDVPKLSTLGLSSYLDELITCLKHCLLRKAALRELAPTLGRSVSSRPGAFSCGDNTTSFDP